MANILRVPSAGGTIVYEEVGRTKGGDGNINADLTKYVGFGLVQTWSGTPPAPDIMTFITASEFKAKTKPFRSCDGSNNSASFYASAEYVNDTQVHISMTASSYPGSLGAILYGFYIE